nr:hypothetical protein [Acidimicrobiales bacterium]
MSHAPTHPHRPRRVPSGSRRRHRAASSGPAPGAAELAGWLLGLVAAAAVLAVSEGALADAPTTWTAAGLREWLEGVGAVPAALRVVHAGAAALVCYLGALTSVALAARS